MNPDNTPRAMLPATPAAAKGGSYVLVLKLKRNVRLTVGRLGRFRLGRGTYLYVGSARLASPATAACAKKSEARATGTSIISCCILQSCSPGRFRTRVRRSAPSPVRSPPGRASRCRRRDSGRATAPPAAPRISTSSISIDYSCVCGPPGRMSSCSNSPRSPNLLCSACSLRNSPSDIAPAARYYHHLIFGS